MKHFLKFLLFLVSIGMLVGCGAQNNQVENVESTKETKTINTGKVLEQNVPGKLLKLANKNTMKLNTTLRGSAEIEKEKKAVEEFSEYFLEYIDKNGIEETLEEVNKSKDGVFKKYYVGPYYYLPICEKTDEDVYTIRAHATSRDFIGVELNLNNWKDLSGWTYIKDAAEHFEKGDTNRLWVNGVYWKDPNYLGGEKIQFSVYERFFKVENKTYLFHYVLFLSV